MGVACGAKMSNKIFVGVAFGTNLFVGLAYGTKALGNVLVGVAFQ